MRVGQLSHKGNIRPNNEDKVYTSRKRDLFIIADGMGGHKAGEIASKYAINKVKYYIKNKSHLYKKTEKGILQLIRDAISYANKSIFLLASKHQNLEGMGTTIIAAIVHKNTVYIGHVGDSRAYLISKKSIKQITTDHSLAEELFRRGTLTKEEALNYPHKNIITRALGCSKEIQIDTYVVKLNKGDVLLFCTDGLSNMLNEEEIYKIVSTSQSPYNCAKALIESANLAGGTDNISVIVAKNDY